MTIIGQNYPVQCAAPYQWHPQGFEQLSAGNTAVALAKVPANATFALIQVDTVPARFRDDGTAPTSSIGVEIPISTLTAPMLPFLYSGDLSAIQFIGVGGTAVLNVAYYN